ncbi:MAG: hypothetical protein KH115_02795 [Veillonella sp.]|uniref:polymorphic toxin type 50 domain-containing protein n=1 Tax=Veillonella sp. TaxID=1926307 RepID=UPI001D2016F3|nr:hypothetical protein [Veillonella sp.]
MVRRIYLLRASERGNQGKQIAHTSPSVCKSSGFIGSYVDKDTGDETLTEWGIIHSSKKGAHIVPALPDIT